MHRMALVFLLCLYITWSRLHCPYLPHLYLFFRVCVSEPDRGEEEEHMLLLRFASWVWVRPVSQSVVKSVYIRLRVGSIPRRPRQPGQPSMKLDNVESVDVCWILKVLGDRCIALFFAHPQGPCFMPSRFGLAPAPSICLSGCFLVTTLHTMVLLSAKQAAFCLVRYTVLLAHDQRLQFTDSEFDMLRNAPGQLRVSLYVTSMRGE